MRLTGESAYGLLLSRIALLGAVALVPLVAGAWSSLGTARHVVADRGEVRGTMTVEVCQGWVCTGPFAPDAGGGARPEITVDAPVTHRTGERLPVLLRPGTDEALRAGVAGVLYAGLPFAGSLVLASPVIAGGLRMRRTAWVAGLSGGALMAAAFLAL
ncbi:MAG TPA: hypothetical protein VFY14_02475 [Streptomyces sp.]|nr:hypothetical protein [Streptomyces sp.]